MRIPCIDTETWELFEIYDMIYFFKIAKITAGTKIVEVNIRWNKLKHLN